MMDAYHFKTTWKIESPIERVWDAIYEAEKWPEWWEYVISVREIRKGDAHDIGAIKEYKWGTKFFYSLVFQSELIENKYCKLLRATAKGELDGDGIWTFSEKKGITTVIYFWNVRTTKKWMQFLSPVLKPVFLINHNIVMNSGAIGLAKKLNARLISYK